MWEESQLAVERRNGRLATEAVLMQAVVGSVLDKKGAKRLQELLKGLTDV